MQILAAPVEDRAGMVAHQRIRKVAGLERHPAVVKEPGRRAANRGARIVLENALQKGNTLGRRLAPAAVHLREESLPLLRAPRIGTTLELVDRLAQLGKLFRPDRGLGRSIVRKA